MHDNSFIGYISGLEIKNGFSYEFCNNIKLLKLKDLENNLKEEEYKQLEVHGITKKYFTQDHELNVLIKENVKKDEKLRTLEEMHEMADLLSTFFPSHHSITITAATGFARKRVPHNIFENRIELDISKETLNRANEFLLKLSQMSQADKNKMSYGLKYLNRSITVLQDEDFPSNSHAIFFELL